jgi:hypothetical protein
MSFAPLLPAGGFAGWTFLKRTLPAQQAAFAASPAQARNAEHFREKIGAVRTVDELMSDRRLLRVALGAFGLEADIGKTALIARVLAEGASDERALANRLPDARWAALAGAFRFDGEGPPASAGAGFAEEMLARFTARGFEAAVGQRDPVLRFALNAERELAGLAAEPSSPNTLWFRVMAAPALREVMEVALGLPREIGQVDLDTQLRSFRARATAALGAGEIAQFADPARREDLIRLYTIRAGAAAVPSTSPAALALALLRPA